METKNKQDLVKQIEAYGLKSKLADLAKRSEERRPFRHLPKQFSKGILIGHVAIVPKRSEGTRFVYVIANMMRAQILYDSINLKQTAILVAHYLADNQEIPDNIIEHDIHFASQLFNITNAKRMMKIAHKEGNEADEEVFLQKLQHAHHLADDYKARIQQTFQSTFST